MTLFQQKVYKIVRKIPKGKILTYKQVAEKAGYPKAYRAVGNALNKSVDIPCHRVIKSDGSMGGYREGFAKKKKRLIDEGVYIS